MNKEQLVQKHLEAIGSNCEHDSYCTDTECQHNGMVICKIDKQTAESCARISEEYREEGMISIVTQMTGCPDIAKSIVHKFLESKSSTPTETK